MGRGTGCIHENNSRRCCHATKNRPGLVRMEAAKARPSTVGDKQKVQYSNAQRFRAVDTQVAKDGSLADGAKDATEVLKEMGEQQ